jgi:L-ascorbate metabolism protein UlaG (beta-lactamase superfamily)
MIPIHWGKFNLAFHPWKEPVERISLLAEENKVQILTPQIGQTIELDSDPEISTWWKRLE